MELAIERDQDIPALIYEGRPTVRGSIAHTGTCLHNWSNAAAHGCLHETGAASLLLSYAGSDLQSLPEYCCNTDITLLTCQLSRMQARRNVGPPQTMAWSESQHPGRQLQPSPSPQAQAEGDRTRGVLEPTAPSVAAAQRKDRLGEQGPRGLENGSAVQPAAGGTAGENGTGSESTARAQDESLASPASDRAAEGGQEVSVLSLASELDQVALDVDCSMLKHSCRSA